MPPLPRIAGQSLRTGLSEAVVITFRAEGDDLEMLSQVGPPIFVLGWSNDALAIVIDDRTDWTEVAELVTDSFCLMAPKKLAAQVPRPPAV